MHVSVSASSLDRARELAARQEALMQQSADEAKRLRGAMVIELQALDAQIERCADADLYAGLVQRRGALVRAQARLDSGES